MSFLKVNPELFYLVVQLTPSDGNTPADAEPGVILPLDYHFFEYFDARRKVTSVAMSLSAASILFNYGMNFFDITNFDPESYSPDGDAPEELKDMEKFVETLQPYSAEIELNGYCVIKGSALEELGLAEPEELDDFRTSFDYVRLDLRGSSDVEPGDLFFSLLTERKHSYEPWDSTSISLNELKKKAGEAALTVFKSML